MRELLRSPDAVGIRALEGALEAAGIAAEVVQQTENAYIGTMSFVLWIAEHADSAEVERIVASFRDHWPDRSTGIKETRVSASEGTVQCNRCNYDLRGQKEDGKCPECGHPYRLAPETSCPHCAAEVPLDFGICWRCGKELTPA